MTSIVLLSTVFALLILSLPCANAISAKHKVGKASNVTIMWNISLAPKAKINGGPTLDTSTGRLYVNTGSHVVALNSKDGSQIFSVKNTGYDGFSSVEIADGKLFVGGGEFYHCLDASSGATQWDFALTAVGRTTPLYVNKTNAVYFAQIDGVFYSVDADKGTKQWSAKLDGEVYNQQPVYSAKHGLLFVVAKGDADDKVYGLDVNSGKIVWQFKNYTRTTGVVLSQDESKIIASADGWVSTIRALDSATGKLVWNTTLRLKSPSPYENTAVGQLLDLPVESNGVLYMCYNAAQYGPGLLRGCGAVNIATGKIVWNHKTADWGSPIIETRNIRMLDSSHFIWPTSQGLCVVPTSGKVDEIYTYENDEYDYENAVSNVAMPITDKTIYVGYAQGIVAALKFRTE